MKSIDNLTRVQQDFLQKAYTENSRVPLKLIKLYRRKGLKAVVLDNCGKEIIIPQQELFPHPYYPKHEIIGMELIEKFMGHEPGTRFKVIIPEMPMIHIQHTNGISHFFLYLPMLFDNPHIFKPLY